MDEVIIRDADFVPATDSDILRDHMNLMEELRRQRERDSALDYAFRRQRAYDYISRVEMFTRSLLVLLGAIVLALLLGCWS